MNQERDALSDMVGPLSNTGGLSPPAKKHSSSGRILLYAPPPAPAVAYTAILEAEGYEVFVANQSIIASTLLASADIRFILAVAPVVGPELIKSWKEQAPDVEIRIISSISQTLEHHLVPASELLDFTIRALSAASRFAATDTTVPKERGAKILALCDEAALQLNFTMRERATTQINAAFLGLAEALTATAAEDLTVISSSDVRPETADRVIAEIGEELGCPFPIFEAPPPGPLESRKPTPTELVKAATELINLQEAGIALPELAMRRLAINKAGDIKQESTRQRLHPHAVEAILSASESSRSMERGSILIADGDSASSNLLALRLGNEGYTVIHAVNGRAALASAREHPPGLILSETILAGLDGFALLDQLRQEGFRGIPFIFHSTREDAASINKGLLLGATDYLTKPVNPEVLLTKIQRALNQSIAPAEASARVSLTDFGEATPSIAHFTYDELRTGILIHDRFRIDTDLGEGGMGKIFKARDEKLDEWVVLKIMKTSLSSDGKALNHFKREIRLARRITHPGIVRIYDFWESGTLKFVTMEYLEGDDLRKLIVERGIFPIPIALRVAIELFDALSVAHTSGVVHRDIKPHNILMAPGGKIKILDFGIAQVFEKGAKDGSTITEAIVGTPEYMSPEQLNGSRVDSRTDLYSGGLVLYEMLTGTLPFEGKNRMVIGTQRLHMLPPCWTNSE